MPHRSLPGVCATPVPAIGPCIVPFCSHPDYPLYSMSHDDAIDEIIKLRNAIRAHRDLNEDPSPEDVDLYTHLPE